MTRRHFATIGALWTMAPRGRGDATEERRFERTHATMGTEFRFLVYAGNAKQATAALDAATRRLDALNASLSDYLADSEISRLSAASGRGDWRLLLRDVENVLTWGQRLAAQTGGAFDMTVGPLTRLWRVSRRNGKLPTESRLSGALQATGFQFLELDEKRRRARLTRPGMRLDLGGIAKGYAVDETLKTLLHHGITTALADGGGDLRTLGSPPDAGGWRITLEDLESSSTTVYQLSDLAMATSGDLYQSIRLGDREFSHLIDPKTGLGLEYRRSVTVIAEDAMTADALASALSVLAIEESQALLATHYPTCAARILTRGDHGIERVVLGMNDTAAILRP